MKKIIYPLSLILLFITCSQQSTESSDKSLVEDNDLAELITKRTYYTKQIQNELSSQKIPSNLFPCNRGERGKVF